jgi:hypothetical protein
VPFEAGRQFEMAITGTQCPSSLGHPAPTTPRKASTPRGSQPPDPGRPGLSRTAPAIAQRRPDIADQPAPRGASRLSAIWCPGACRRTAGSLGTRRAGPPWSTSNNKPSSNSGSQPPGSGPTSLGHKGPDTSSAHALGSRSKPPSQSESRSDLNRPPRAAPGP